MKYVTPEIEVLEFTAVDIIQTSSDPENPDGPKEPPITGGNDLPIN